MTRLSEQRQPNHPLADLARLSLKYRTFELDPRENCVRQVGVRQVCPSEVRVGEISSRDHREAQVGALQISIHENGTLEISATKICVRQIRAIELRPLYCCTR